MSLWAPGRPHIVIRTQSVLPVRVRDGAVRVPDRAASGIHRQRVDCARVEDGSAVAICSQEVAPRHVTSRHVTSRHVTSRHVTSRHVTSCHAVLGRVTSRLVALRRVASRQAATTH